jgi:hypothetical protein
MILARCCRCSTATVLESINRTALDAPAGMLYCPVCKTIQPHERVNPFSLERALVDTP